MADTHKQSNSQLESSEQHKEGSASRRQGMSREEAGRKGGLAPHRCRGFGCQKRQSSEQEE